MSRKQILQQTTNLIQTVEIAVDNETKGNFYQSRLDWMAVALIADCLAKNAIRNALQKNMHSKSNK